ncbi:hypothetical protein Efla_007859 [Eimeria flavescens]
MLPWSQQVLRGVRLARDADTLAPPTCFVIQAKEICDHVTVMPERNAKSQNQHITEVPQERDSISAIDAATDILSALSEDKSTTCATFVRNVYLLEAQRLLRYYDITPVTKQLLP